MNLSDRIRRWWRAEVDVGAGVGCELTVHTAMHGLEYDVWIGGQRYTVHSRWWDTRRSIARKMRKKLRQL